MPSTLPLIARLVGIVLTVMATFSLLLFALKLGGIESLFTKGVIGQVFTLMFVTMSLVTTFTALIYFLSKEGEGYNMVSKDGRVKKALFFLPVCILAASSIPYSFDMGIYSHEMLPVFSSAHLSYSEEGNLLTFIDPKGAFREYYKTNEVFTAVTLLLGVSLNIGILIISAMKKATQERKQGITCVFWVASLLMLWGVMALYSDWTWGLYGETSRIVWEQVIAEQGTVRFILEMLAQSALCLSAFAYIALDLTRSLFRLDEDKVGV